MVVDNEYMEWIVPGWKDFINFTKPYVEPPIVAEYNLYDDSDHSMEEATPGDVEEPWTNDDELYEPKKIEYIDLGGDDE